MSVARRVALVTGANKGLGLELVRQLASADSQLTVLMGARDATRGSASAAALGLPNVTTLSLDVTSPASVAAAAKEVASRYGRIDLLVNNAGVFVKQRDTSGAAAVIDETFAPNYFGVRDCCQAFMPILNHNGRVVNVSSELAEPALAEMSAENRAALEKPDLTVAELDGLLSSYRSACVSAGGPAAGWPASAYGLSKAAVIALTRILGRDTVNGARTAEQGASALARICNLPADDRSNGRFFLSS